MSDIILEAPADEPEWPSVEDTAPEEEGGPIARGGFDYQDEIAVSFLLEMIEKPQLLRVHCETHDDIVLIWIDVDGANTAEFVQVKGELSRQLWSPAMLCNREKGRVGTSIFDKFLGKDKHSEQSAFRMVTRRPAGDELKLLTYDKTLAVRDLSAPAMIELKTAIEDKVKGHTSPKGNGTDYWLKRCFWDECQSEDDARHQNLVKVMRLAKCAGVDLLIDQADVLLNDLRRIAREAGVAKWATHKHIKIITRTHLLSWWKPRIASMALGGDGASGGKLQAKMRDASLTDSQVRMALDLRLDYAREVRTPKYMQDDESDQLQRKVKSAVNSLQADYIAGNLKVSASEFHALCLRRVKEIAAEVNSSNSNLEDYVQGCLYDITDRCLLQFARSSL